MSVVVYELNEVPQRLFNFYADAFPNSAFASLRSRSNLFKTLTADVGQLSPWITWPTMHRGVSNVDHEISELGQTLTDVNVQYPNVYNILAKGGVKVGVFGSLQSYPLPTDLDNFCFYVPDTFAASDECLPGALSDFQAFNLSMVQANGRNVGRGVVLKDAARFLASAISLGLTPTTFFKLANQILAERINEDRVVRRRTSQVEIAFDLYFSLLKKTQPDISFFFTNHVASSMHRYWPTIFPHDYEEGKFDEGWLAQWADEIPHAIKVANFQLTKLIDHCHVTGSELIVCTSMGQSAVEDVEPIETQALITNLNRLLTHCGFTKEDWEPKLAMAPRVVFTPKTKACFDKIESLSQLKINEQRINVAHTSSGDIRLDINLINQGSIEVSENGKILDSNKVGIENVHLQDASGSYAYHIPEGILLHYQPTKINGFSNDKTWRTISVLDFAPSLLKKFSVNRPSYMNKENLFIY